MEVCHFNKGWKKNKKTQLKTRIKPSKSNPILKQIDVISYFEALQKKFILAPIDKASNIGAITCKRYYVEEILNEIGIIGLGNNINCKANKVCAQIIDKKIENLKLKIFSKMLNFCQIITSLGLTKFWPHHSIIK